MLPSPQILVRPIALAASAVSLLLFVTACGQSGGLYLPTEPVAAKRATLPQTLGVGTPSTATAPKSSASSPISP